MGNDDRQASKCTQDRTVRRSTSAVSANKSFADAASGTVYDYEQSYSGY